MNEISSENQAELEKRYKTTAIIVAAQIATTVVLIVIGWFLAGDSENDAASGSLMPLWIAILFVAIGTFVLRRFLTNWDRFKTKALLKGIPGVLAALQTNAIILSAMAEVISITGFLIAILNGVRADMLRAGVVALIVFLMNFPRKSVWRKIVANLERI